MSEVTNKYQTVDEIQSIVKAFNEFTLPHSRWDHHAHLTVALWYLIRHPEKQAISLIRDGIQRYNQAMKIANTHNSGYHETMTLFWIYLVSHYLKDSQASGYLLELTNKLH
ncbi:MULTISPECIES: hypothetical protein [unclassified Anabaena]|uniref:hypothetical protein n=1 Tax=unclassified Anabaena TaxID=2619674 RepID=UPI002B1EF17D|nr:hypothetical protein [Anabaena sp. UHCC 0399]MEA5564637.1 hypothetical protein [Anabaena sp. UHCC 0399]